MPFEKYCLKTDCVRKVNIGDALVHLRYYSLDLLLHMRGFRVPVFLTRCLSDEARLLRLYSSVKTSHLSAFAAPILSHLPLLPPLSGDPVTSLSIRGARPAHAV